MIILEDCNINLLKVSSSTNLISLFQNYDCGCTHDLITRPGSGGCIDHIFSKLTERLNIDSVECTLSGHSININIENLRAKDYLRDFDASDLTNTLISFIETAVTKLNRPLPFELTPWINRNLQKLVSFKHRLLRKRRRSRNNGNIEIVL